MNLARLNHILIPPTKDGRDRFRQTPAGRLVSPLFRLYLALTPEGRFLSVFVLLAGAAGLEVGTTQIYVLFALITGLLAASLLARRAFRLKDVAVTLEAPRRATVGEPLPIAIVVTNRGEQPVHDLAVTTPLLPWDGRWAFDAARIAVAPPGDTVRIRLAARFLERGDHHLDPFHLGRVVPLGIAFGPVLDTAGVRFLVRPRPATVGAVPLRMGSEARTAEGRQLAPDARDLAGTRPYRAGDRVRDLHARSWARLGLPVVREWREDRVADAGLVLALYPGARQEVTDAAVALASGLVVRLAELGVGLHALFVGDQPPLFGPSLATPDAALDAIARAATPRSAEGPALAAVEHHLQGVGTLYWVSDGYSAPGAPPDAPSALRGRGLPVELVAVIPGPRRGLSARRKPTTHAPPSGPWSHSVSAPAVLGGQRIDLTP